MCRLRTYRLHIHTDLIFKFNQNKIIGEKRGEKYFNFANLWAHNLIYPSNEYKWFANIK